MPRGQKSKLRACEKRHQARSEIQRLQDAQATAAAEEESTPSSSPQREGVTQSPPAAAGSSSTSQGPRRASTTTTASVGVSCTRCEEASNNGEEDRASTYEALASTESSGTDFLSEKAVLLEQFLLYKYKMKQPTMKEDMLKIINPNYEDRFAEILKIASEHIEAIFALEVKEVDSTSPSYGLISKLKLPNNGRVRGGRGLPKTGLLMNILGMILIKGNCATEEEIWKFLSMMQVYAGRKHYIYGEPRKLITKDLVRLKYLEYRQVPDTDPPRYEFLWGPKAYAETSKMQVLEFLGKIHDTIPNIFPSHYVEVLQGKEEKATAIDAAGATAKVCAPSGATDSNLFPALLKSEVSYPPVQKP
ncbi:melanoma-associated antigen B5-like [Diceros bicornis minor]|uniref:melanoma-associated antigen B5-like n=1 Tax=Diceros bicornis minor TaxID=77932 RepID=UPI0026EECC31|nr:melanoma-associated antigen B5-like [Diceros bicornis minor]